MASRGIDYANINSSDLTEGNGARLDSALKQLFFNAFSSVVISQVTSSAAIAVFNTDQVTSSAVISKTHDDQVTSSGVILANFSEQVTSSAVIITTSYDDATSSAVISHKESKQVTSSAVISHKESKQVTSSAVIGQLYKGECVSSHTVFVSGPLYNYFIAPYSANVEANDTILLVIFAESDNPFVSVVDDAGNTFTKIGTGETSYNVGPEFTGGGPPYATYVFMCANCNATTTGNSITITFENTITIDGIAVTGLALNSGYTITLDQTAASAPGYTLDVSVGPTGNVTSPSEFILAGFGGTQYGTERPYPTITFAPGSGWTAGASVSGSTYTPSLDGIWVFTEFKEPVIASGAYTATGTLSELGNDSQWTSGVLVTLKLVQSVFPVQYLSSSAVIGNANAVFYAVRGMEYDRINASSLTQVYNFGFHGSGFARLNEGLEQIFFNDFIPHNILLSYAVIFAPTFTRVTSSAVIGIPNYDEVTSSAVITHNESDTVTSSAVINYSHIRQVTSSAVIYASKHLITSKTVIGVVHDRTVTSKASIKIKHTRQVTSSAVTTAPPHRLLTTKAVVITTYKRNVTSKAVILTDAILIETSAVIETTDNANVSTVALISNPFFTCKVIGRVVDYTGNPIKGMLLTVQLLYQTNIKSVLQNGVAIAIRPLYATTDSGGNFEFNLIRPDQFTELPNRYLLTGPGIRIKFKTISSQTIYFGGATEAPYL